MQLTPLEIQVLLALGDGKAWRTRHVWIWLGRHEPYMSVAGALESLVGKGLVCRRETTTAGAVWWRLNREWGGRR